MSSAEGNRVELYLCELSLGLPGAGQRVAVAAVQLARDVADDAHAGGGGAGVGHGARDVRGAGCAVVDGRNRAIAAGGPSQGGALAERQVLHEAREGHAGDGSGLRWRGRLLGGRSEVRRVATEGVDSDLYRGLRGGGVVWPDGTTDQYYAGPRGEGLEDTARLEERETGW